MKREYTEKMGEISGFGGGYEQACRKMVLGGLDWLDKNPEANPVFQEFKNVYGVTTGENDDMKNMQSAMFEASGKDCTGAMMQACTSHILFIKKNGWEKYVDEMSKPEKTEK